MIIKVFSTTTIYPQGKRDILYESEQYIANL